MDQSTSFKPAASLTEQIANYLSDEIISGKLGPEERIQELKVARHLGVSRGSVREALLILEGRHLIEIVPRRGAFVSALSRAHVDGLFEIASTLLTMLVCKAARRWKERAHLDGFDQSIVEMAEALEEGDAGRFAAATSDYFRCAFPLNGNCYLHSIVEDLLPAYQRLLVKVLAAEPQRMRQDLEELRRVLSAMRLRDADEAERAMIDYGERQRRRAREIAPE